ncbi:hypothetical protein HHI36_013434 [Cryptolaemus montrouzieri]|uniref:Uncharacterized protein n=1 Tax=Cryptolaemus montrouzieri TaxID=559131 RepID=A0ABD2NHS9_9CUCU
MLTMLTMHRENEDSGNGEGRHWPTAPTQNRGSGPGSAVEEFVDILQVQQLLLESGGRIRGSGEPPNFSSPPAAFYHGAYGGLNQQQHPPYHHGPVLPTSSTVDDLVALWFAGSSASGNSKIKFITSIY